MHYITPDTCTVLNFATNSRLEPIVHALQKLLDQNKIRLVICEEVLHEFDRHKEDIAHRHATAAISRVKDVRKELYLLGDAKQEAANAILDELSKAIRSDEQQVRRRLQTVEGLLNHPSNVRLEPSSEQQVRVCQDALSKKAPFHNSKNNVADALILRMFADFAQTCEPDAVLYFISDNTHEFSDKADNRKAHPDFADIFATTRSNYEPSILSVIKGIDERALDEEDSTSVEEAQTYEDEQLSLPRNPYAESQNCPDGQLHDFKDYGRWMHSRFGGGLSWHLACKRCGALVDTGEHWD